MMLITWHGFANRTCLAFIVLLCFFVGTQMLGLPNEMWSPWEESDTYENLDFAIPPSNPQLNLSTPVTTSEMPPQNLHNLLLPHAVFHPPKSPQ